MKKKLKSWQGWLLFGGSMVVVFALGLCISTLMERRTEIKSTLINHKTVIGKLEARNEVFKNDYPREYVGGDDLARFPVHNVHDPSHKELPAKGNLSLKW